MNMNRIMVILVALSVAGCGEKEQAQPAMESAPAAVPEPPVAVMEIWDDEAFVAHMHEHADKLDELNFALADGDLETAKADAGWLANHETNADIQAEWMPFLYAMRTEAEAVAAAPDIDTARAAAERITVKCQECHTAANVTTPL